MTEHQRRAAVFISILLDNADKAEQSAMLRAVITVAGGGLMVLEGSRAASEALYVAADGLVAVPA